MKHTTRKALKSSMSLLLALCMMFSMLPISVLAAESTDSGVEGMNDDGKITYVSIGDSMTNGYCLDGYDGTSGAVNYGIETYGNDFAAWLAGYAGEIADDQVIFTGANGTVDHRQLSISGLRAQDIQWILNMDYTNESLMKEAYDSSWNESTWYDNWKFYGDRYTWSEYCDNDYRYADAAARILYVYGQNGHFTSSYADETVINNVIAGVKADPYYPEGDGDTAEMGDHKILQIATEFYQKSMADADIISLAVGNTNFGTHMLSNITDVIMGGDMSFSKDYSIDRVKALYADDGFVTDKVNEMLQSDDYAQIVEKCAYLAGGNAEYEEEIKYIVEYCMTHFIVGYIGMLNAILELNPDAEIIQIALMNAYEGKDENGNPVVNKDTLGELVHVIYSPVNAFLKALPAELLASKTEEQQAQYADARFYFAEAGYVSCMVDVFGDDYYAQNGSFVEYPGLLSGTEGYEANNSSIVRDRFAEEIVCGDMIFAAMGKQKLDTQENIQNFLKGGVVYNTDGSEAYDGVGAIAYDMMTLTDKAAYAAQNAAAATEYAMYLAFENSLIRSGTQDVTMDALAGLSNIQSAFAAFYPEVTAAIGAARKDYYAAAAPVIVAGSDGALTNDDVIAIMDAVEEVKAGVWAAFADYHEALKNATGHTSIEHVINCDTCMNDGGHGDGYSEKIVATYKEQMDLLPYTIVAEMSEDQHGGLLDGADIKRLCEAADYENEVYALVSEKSANYSEDGSRLLTEAQAKTLATEEDGVWIVAGEIAGQDPDTVKMAYENNIVLTDEQRASIETLMSVREAVLVLLAKDEAGNFTTRDKFASSAAGIASAIDAASQLAYLLALPQAMSDKLYENTDMRGALCMNARCLLGTGAGGHPSVGGHEALYDAVMTAYNNVTYQWNEDNTACIATRACGYGEPETAEAKVTSEVKSATTCTENGVTTYTATFDVFWAETQTKDIQDTAAVGHKFTNYVPNNDAACEKNATETAQCDNNCGESDTREIEGTKLGHSYEAVVTAPTCTEGGYTTYTCSVCDDTYTADETAATGHNYGEDGKCACGATDPDAHPVCEYVVAETLVSGNTYMLTLGGNNVGSYTFTEIEGGWAIQAADGTYLALEDEALAYTEQAFAWTYADGCFSAETAGSSSGNSWFGNIFGGWWGSDEETYYLVSSGSTVAVSTSNANAEAMFYTAHSDTAHQFDDGVVTAPTCTQDGCTTYTCERCGYSYTGDTTPALGHNYNSVVTEPTCTKDGYTTHTCANCGDSYVDSRVDATGHTMVDGVCGTCGYTEGTTQPEEGECTYLAEQTLTSGQTYVLTLGGNQVGTYTFTEIEGGWAIQAADGAYLALEDEALISSAEPFAWTYADGCFSAEVAGSSSGNNWFGGIFGNLWGSDEETYYLVSSGDAVAVSTSDADAQAKFYQEVTGEHAFGDPVANNGSHVYTCVNCGAVKTESCTDADCALCHPAAPEASIKVSVDVTSSSSGNNWFGNIFGNWWGSSSTTYTATITVEAEGTEVESVAYSTDGGSTWTEGTTFTSSSEINAFDIRVEAANGQTYYFTYSNGAVTEKV